ncbi:hypothetical protein BJ508DRAFT_304924 [Ascobolus immersus RN42]|uniref:RING-type domain-containing protein n=1 Tax=Ascobolus immersus RN42 TaxID=1160509 RepID=A0A3N4ICI7_ASCIM|nr:hypothetical protein BJ508DRAFT_304924 [Ascobolus immersus RN42]
MSTSTKETTPGDSKGTRLRRIARRLRAFRRTVRRCFHRSRSRKNLQATDKPIQQQDAGSLRDTQEKKRSEESDGMEAVTVSSKSEWVASPVAVVALANLDANDDELDEDLSEDLSEDGEQLRDEHPQNRDLSVETLGPIPQVPEEAEEGASTGADQELDPAPEALQRQEFENNDSEANENTETTKVAYCTACSDKIPVAYDRSGETYVAICGCSYCGSCFAQFYRNAVASMGLFPPTCCKKTLTLSPTTDWSPDCVQRHYLFLNKILPADVVDAYVEKAIEYTDPKPIYSHAIPASTCILCGQAEHTGQNCTDDDSESLKEFFEYASIRKWKRCFSCRRMVARRGGCNELKCVCGKTFCYGCGEEYGDHYNYDHDDCDYADSDFDEEDVQSEDEY